MGRKLEGELRVRKFYCFKMGNIIAHLHAFGNDPVGRGNDYLGERRKNWWNNHIG